MEYCVDGWYFGDFVIKFLVWLFLICDLGLFYKLLYVLRKKEGKLCRVRNLVIWGL